MSKTTCSEGDATLALTGAILDAQRAFAERNIDATLTIALPPREWRLLTAGLPDDANVPPWGTIRTDYGVVQVMLAFDKPGVRVDRFCVEPDE